MEAFRRRDLGDFVYALEFLGADVNQPEGTGLTIFQKVLRTPDSADFIRSCISNGADCYKVRLTHTHAQVKNNFILF